MIDAEFETQKSRIASLEQYWCDALGLVPTWTIRTRYVRDGYVSPNPDAQDKGSGVADCSVNWQYQDAVISWNMPEITLLDDEELDRTVCHEVMHILLNEMREGAETNLNHEERVATGFQRALFSLRDSLKCRHENALKGMIKGPSHIKDAAKIPGLDDRDAAVIRMMADERRQRRVITEDPASSFTT